MTLSPVPRLNLLAGGYGVGEVTFPRAGLIAHRAIAGLLLDLPFEIVLRSHVQARERLYPLPEVVVVGVRLSISLGQDELAVGVAEDRYSTPTESRGTCRFRLPADAVWEIERRRESGPLRFAATATATIFRTHAFEVTNLQGERDRERLLSLPEDSREALELEYGAHEWQRVLNAAGFGEHVTVQIDLPMTPPAPWDSVWKAVREAREALHGGGTSGWKACVSACRLALERWREIEPEDHGTGWQAPSPGDRKERTTLQRRENLRWDLLQCAHQGPHTDKDDWTRDDAVLLLAGLTALLAKRRP